MNIRDIPLYYALKYLIKRQGQKLVGNCHIFSEEQEEQIM